MSGRITPHQTQAEWFAEQALSAWRTGQAANAEGQVDLARRWFERARRFAPEDATVALSLATVLLRQNNPESARMFAEVTALHDLREAWFGLAASHGQRGAWHEAAAALTRALSQHVISDLAEMTPLADRIAQEVGAPAWCCIAADGSVHIGGRESARLSRTIVAWLDDRRLPARPRKRPRRGRALALLHHDRPLLGSPLALDRLLALEGFVENTAGGLAGWAWHPADPATDPRLMIVTSDGKKRLNLVARDGDMPSDRPLARPRRFAVSAAALGFWRGAIHVTGADGRDLPGSPLVLQRGAAAAAAAVSQDLAADMPAVGRRRNRRPVPDPHDLAMAADLVGPPPRARLAPQRSLVVVVPAYRDAAMTLACLASVRATMPPRTRLIVVDDATPEPALAAALDDLVARGAIDLVRHPVNRGFPGAANSGLRAAAALRGGPDVVLLNADALVTAGALDALRALVQSSRDIGTATPLSNDATIVSYPHPAGNPLPSPVELHRLGRLANQVNAGIAVDMPTAVGFCMYIRRECLIDVGLFRETVFAQGYGEENDFCLRARHLGWRHVAAAGVFVGHAGAASFGQGSLGAARLALMARNLTILERLHPGYAALIDAHIAADPLAAARRRLDAARWAQRRRRPATSVILVTHDSGGGVERVIRARCAALTKSGKRAIVLRPVRDPAATSADERSYRRGLCEVCDGEARDTPNLRFALPAERDALIRLLRADRPDHIELHHLLGHDPVMLELAARLDIPWEVMIHDYAWFCPRITLLSPQRQYCGEPTEPAVCEACIADGGRHDEAVISVAALRAQSAVCLGGARRVVVPSGDAGARIRRHFPQVRPDAVALEDDTERPAARTWSAAPRRIGVVGAIGAEKGYDVLLGCARDAAWRRLPLEFVVIGHTIDDSRLLATGYVFITGPYRETDAVREITAQSPDFAFLPSIWPETWCFTLGEAWRAGLHVAAFDIGAPAERIRRTGRGWLLPLGLPPAAVNNALLSFSPPADE